MFQVYNIKHFAAVSNIHKAKTIRHGPNHRRQREHHSKGRDSDPPGSELLDTLAFAAEFIFYSKFGCFYFVQRIPPAVLVVPESFSISILL